MNNKKAFTLAEVLITLTILGVVAAIAVPNMIQSYQKKATITRFKVAYSLLSKLTDDSFAVYGYPTKTNSSAETFEYFRPFLEISKECGYPGYAKEHGCFSNDSWYSLENKNWNFGGGYGPTATYQVLLKNGMGLALFRELDNLRIKFFIDIDGPNKGLSKLGQDVFQFTYVSETHMKRCSSTFHAPVASYLVPGPGNSGECCSGTNYCPAFYRDRDKILDGCKINGADSSNGPAGASCSALITKDGFKISSDYPWDYANKKPE